MGPNHENDVMGEDACMAIIAEKIQTNNQTAALPYKHTFSCTYLVSKCNGIDTQPFKLKEEGRSM